MARRIFSPEPILPNIKAAIKWTRQTEKRTKRNLDTKTRLKTLFKKAKNGAESASTVESQLDKAANKGIIHPSNSRRDDGKSNSTLPAAAAPAAKPVRKASKKK